MDIKKIMKDQPIINIGMIGHVSNGKSTIVKSLTGKSTQAYSNEKERNITIKLGYANSKIYKCNICESPENYVSTSSDIYKLNCKFCNTEMELVNHISFTDCFEPSTKVLTYDGNIKMISELTTNDVLIGPNGGKRKILKFFDGEKDLYEINYLTASINSILPNKFICTGGHLLVLRIDTPVSSIIKKYNKYIVRKISANDREISSKCHSFETKEEAQIFRNQNINPIIFEMTVETYLNLPITSGLRKKARMFYSPPLEFDTDPFNISIPNMTDEEVGWLLGLWLGDGTKTRSSFAIGAKDTEIMNNIEILAKKMNLMVNKYYYDNKNCYEVMLQKEISTTNGKKRKSYSHQFNDLLVKLNLINNKHIGPKLLFQKRTVREAILAGYVDSDGYYGKGEFEIVQSEEHKNLIDGLLWIAKSLGYSCGVSKKLGTINKLGITKQFGQYRLKFNGETSRLPICTERKRGKNLERNWATSQPFLINPIGKGKFRGFEIDNDGRFLLADFICVHNCPGHWNLMSTMLNGTCVMDYTILVESLHNENIPSPQTIEHVKATTMTNTPNKIICINKLDLVKRDDVHDKLDIFKKYAKNTILEKSPIVPIVASKGLNIDILCQELAKLPIPERKINNNFKMIIIRSFNANKPGTSIFDLNGGVIGGSLVNGLVNKNDEVILKPGFIINNTKFNNQNDDSKKWIYSPIRAKILSINSEKNQLESAIPGGLIGVQLDIDPSIATNDNLAGNLMLSPNIENEYSVFEDVEIEFHNFDNKNISFKQGDKLYINANANNQLCSVLRHKKNKIVLNLLLHPICVKIGDCVTISINSQNSEGITIIGSGIVIKGNPSELLK